jgi:tRNA1Val (adenine37-N6)-methyltransferase
MVHRPTRLADIFAEMHRVHIEPKRLRMVHPYRDQEPTQVLIEGVLDGGSELRVMPPLIVYEQPGQYTAELLRIYGMES